MVLDETKKELEKIKDQLKNIKIKPLNQDK
jgi:hypothetical protein